MKSMSWNTFVRNPGLIYQARTADLNSYPQEKRTLQIEWQVRLFSNDLNSTNTIRRRGLE